MPRISACGTTTAARFNAARELDRIIGAWTANLTAAEVDRRLIEADIPCTPVYTAAKIAADPQFRHRGMVHDVEDPQFGHLLHAGIVPHVPDDPGRIRWPGPPIGAHTEEVLAQLLELSRAEIAALRQERVV